MMKNHKAYYTVEPSPVGNLYYFGALDRADGPYLEQRRVAAIVDVASDGTLAGFELIFDMPPPPKPLDLTAE